MPRKRHDHPPTTLEEAWDQQIHRSAQPCKAIASHLGQTRQAIEAPVYPEREPRAYIHADWLVPATLLTRNFAVLDFLEAACGRVAFDAPAFDAPSDEDLRDAVMSLTEKLGQAAEEIRVDLKPDSESGAKLSPSEKARIKEKLYRLRKEAARAYAMVEASE